MSQGQAQGSVRVSPQALDEEYLKVDAQFGGVDQRKIFTFAEKVRNGGVGVPCGLVQGWETHRSAGRSVSVVCERHGAPCSSCYCSGGLQGSGVRHGAATHPWQWLPGLCEPPRACWVPLLCSRLPGARSTQGLWVKVVLQKRIVRDLLPCSFPVPPFPGLRQAHPPDEPDGSRPDGQQNELVGRGWSLRGGWGQGLCRARLRGWGWSLHPERRKLLPALRLGPKEKVQQRQHESSLGQEAGKRAAEISSSRTQRSTSWTARRM